jgi:hypothetical protein
MQGGVFQNYRQVISQEGIVLLFQPLSIALDNNANYHMDMPFVNSFFFTKEEIYYYELIIIIAFQHTI